VLRPRYQCPTRWYPSREQGSGNGCLSGEENTDLEQEVSGTLSKGDHSHPGEQDFCVPAITIQGGPAMSVFVVGLNGCRLMPTSERKARLLLKHGKASVYRKVPFTIKLNYKTGSTTQSGYLGIDTGSQHIGVSVVREDGTVLHKEEIGLRDSMSKRKLMQSRASSRRGRRHRKTRYRHPKWRPKAKRVYCKTPDRKGRHWKKRKITFASKRPKGWLPPSLQSKTDHHIRWIKKLQDLLPEGYRLSIELGRFDPARLKDPEIHGELYQKGPQYDYENVRAYVLNRDRYTCQVCGKKGGKLHVHHILYRSHGATDDPQYMATVCSDCHNTENHHQGGILYQWMQKQKKFTRGLRDATFMNILRKRLIEAFPGATFTYGNITKADRERLILPKSHGNDATAIAIVKTGIMTVKDKEPVIYIQQVRRKKRSLHEETPRKGRKEPNRKASRYDKNTKAVTVTKRKNKKKISITGCLFDRVELNGKKGWISGFTDKSCYVKDENDQYIRTSPKYKQVSLSKLKILHHCGNWAIGARRSLGKG